MAGTATTTNQLSLAFGAADGRTPEELRQRVRELSAELMNRARAQWPDVIFPDPVIRFRLRGRTAGEACAHTGVTNYNQELMERHGEEFIQEIVPHEIAHVIAPRLHPRRIRPHGREWKAVMKFFGAPARTRHTYETMPVPEAGRIPYRCACDRMHWMTTRSHRRRQRGHVEYSCRECGEVLVYVKTR